MNNPPGQPVDRPRKARKAGRILGIIGAVLLVLILCLIVAAHKMGITIGTPPNSQYSSETGPASTKPSALTNAIQNGDLNTVKNMLAKDPSLANSKSSTGETPLFDAAFAGNREIAALLIAKGADVNAKNQVGETALDRATFFQHDDVAKLLKEHGAKSGKS